MLLTTPGAGGVFINLTGDAYCASARRGLNSITMPTAPASAPATNQ